MKSQVLSFIAALFLIAIAPASAHDTWLIPAQFKIAPGETATFDLTSGMAFPKLDVAPKRERIDAVLCRLSGRTWELKDFDVAPNSLRITGVLTDVGVAALWVNSPPREIALKPDQVQEYLNEIDAPAKISQQWAEMKEPRRWRESYRKHSKTFVRVGDTKADISWREPVGMFLEIVPENDPTALRAGDELIVRVLKDRKPLADFSLGIIAEGDSKGSINKTDGAGHAKFRLDKAGRWLLRGTDLRKSTKPEIDWESDFTTLTVEIGKE